MECPTRTAWTSIETRANAEVILSTVFIVGKISRRWTVDRSITLDTQICRFPLSIDGTDIWTIHRYSTSSSSSSSLFLVPLVVKIPRLKDRKKAKIKCLERLEVRIIRFNETVVQKNWVIIIIIIINNNNYNDDDDDDDDDDNDDSNTNSNNNSHCVRARGATSFKSQSQRSTPNTSLLLNWDINYYSVT